MTNRQLRLLLNRHRLSEATCVVLGSPQPQCFDYNTDRLALLLNFVKHKVTNQQHDDVKTHLLQCPRCRLLYTRTVDEVYDS